jgi:hypothetical protein
MLTVAGRRAYLHELPLAARHIVRQDELAPVLDAHAEDFARGSARALEHFDDVQPPARQPEAARLERAPAAHAIDLDPHAATVRASRRAGLTQVKRRRAGRRTLPA